MCFCIDDKHPNKKIAKRDITCYKILWDNYVSFFQHKPYKLNNLYKNKISEPVLWGGYRLVDKGFHSFTSLEKVIYERALLIKKINDSDSFVPSIPNDCIIVKCIIPKDSEYYYNSSRKEYVSNQIKLIEKIK